MTRRGAAAAVLLACLHPATAAVAEDRRCVAGLFCIEAVAEPAALSLWISALTATDLTVAVELTLLAEETLRSRAKVAIDRPGRRPLLRVPHPAEPMPPYRWAFTFHPGHEPQRHARDVVYRLPFAPGTGAKVIQGPNGGFTHRGPDRHATDWALPAGGLITAARAGRVIGLYRDAPPGGADREHLGGDNFVWIAHDDGTVGWYAHFRAGSLLVRQDQWVAPGTPLGIAGTSGFSTEPHLHFHVSTPSRGPTAYETLPAPFALAPGIVGIPVEGTIYRAFAAE